VPGLVAITLGSSEGEYPEFLRMLPLKKLDRATIEAALKRMVEPGSELKTDGLSVYGGLSDAGYRHEQIVMAGLSPQAHFRWVHIAISNVKAFIDGAFHGVTKQHLGEYLHEFCYRFNRRRWEGELFGRLVHACLVAKLPVALSRAT
jgi:transposase-like protein